MVFHEETLRRLFLGETSGICKLSVSYHKLPASSGTSEHFNRDRLTPVLPQGGKKKNQKAVDFFSVLTLSAKSVSGGVSSRGRRRRGSASGPTRPLAGVSPLWFGGERLRSSRESKLGGQTSFRRDLNPFIIVKKKEKKVEKNNPFPPPKKKLEPETSERLAEGEPAGLQTGDW